MKNNTREDIFIQANEDTNANETHYKDMYLRTLADFENYKKRKTNEIENIKEMANIDVIKDILPIVDDIEDGVSLNKFYKDEFNREEDKGLLILYKEIKNLLTKYGIERYGNIGEKFDPNVHDAVYMSNEKRVDSGCISLVFRYGYRKGNNIIRFAKVYVEE